MIRLYSNTSCHPCLVSVWKLFKTDKGQKGMTLKFTHLEIWVFSYYLILTVYAINAEFSILTWATSYKTISISDFMQRLGFIDPWSLSKNWNAYICLLEIRSIPVTGHLASSGPQPSSPMTAPRLSVSAGIWKQQPGFAPGTFFSSHQGLH